MIKELMEYLRANKSDLIKTQELTVKISESGGYCSTCWYPSEYEDRVVETIDFDELEKAMEEFQKTFQKDGVNGHRNPLNK